MCANQTGTNGNTNRNINRNTNGNTNRNTNGTTNGNANGNTNGNAKYRKFAPCIIIFTVCYCANLITRIVANIYR